MFNKTLGAALTALAFSSVAQAADIPQTPQDIVMDVAKKCMPAVIYQDSPDSEEFRKSWAEAGCVEAVQISNAHLDFSRDQVLEDIGSDPETFAVQESISFLWEMAQDGFPTGIGLINSSLNEYMLGKGMAFWLDYNS